MTNKPQPPQPKVQVFQMRNRLKEKAMMGVQGGPQAGPGSIAAEALEKMEAEFQKAAEQFPQFVASYLESLKVATEAAIADRDKDLRPHVDRIHKLAHELKGQGSTFGYPLMSSFGQSLYNFTKPGVTITDKYPELLKAHYDAMNAVIVAKIKGDGGEIGKQLIIVLQKAIQKYAPATK